METASRTSPEAQSPLPRFLAWRPFQEPSRPNAAKPQPLAARPSDMKPWPQAAPDQASWRLMRREG